MVPIGYLNPRRKIKTPPLWKIFEQEEKDIIRIVICMWLYYGTSWWNGTPTSYFFLSPGWSGISSGCSLFCSGYDFIRRGIEHPLIQISVTWFLWSRGRDRGHMPLERTETPLESIISLEIRGNIPRTILGDYRGIL
jgi:hypothetical protein